MFKSLLIAAAALYCTGAPAAELTAQELAWLRAAAPVLAYARGQQLPIDIVVQPLAGPNDVPMAMGFEGKRCKLVLSMRGRSDDVDAIFDGVAMERRAWMIEAMAAHEVGHCWRWVQGVWHALPAGFTVGAGAAGETAETIETIETAESNEVAATAEQRLAVLRRELRQTRREEGFSDLVALAWTARRDAGSDGGGDAVRYRAVLAWLHAVRSAAPLPGGGHDTLAWLALARDPATFARAATPFEAVAGVWSAGLLQDE